MAESKGASFPFNAGGCSFTVESTGGPWDEALATIHARWSDEEPGPDVGRVRFGVDLGPRPDRPPELSDGPTLGWTGDSPRLVLGSTEIELPDPQTVLIQGDPNQAERVVHESWALILGWLLAPLQRWALHGAVPIPANHGIGVLALGHSGTGKSTVAASAIMAGWPVLGDDLAIVRTDTQVPEVRGVRQPLALPGEFEGVLGPDRAASRRDARNRRILDADIPHGWFRLGAIAVLSHGSEPRSTVEVGSAMDPMKILWTAHFPAALPSRLESWFPVATQLCRSLPIWRVALGSDASQRLASTAEAFETIVAELEPF